MGDEVGKGEGDAEGCQGGVQGTVGVSHTLEEGAFLGRDRSSQAENCRNAIITGSFSPASS